MFWSPWLDASVAAALAAEARCSSVCGLAGASAGGVPEPCAKSGEAAVKAASAVPTFRVVVRLVRIILSLLSGGLGLGLAQGRQARREIAKDAVESVGLVEVGRVSA